MKKERLVAGYFFVNTSTNKTSFTLILVLLFPSVDSLSLLEDNLASVVYLTSFPGILLLSLERQNVTVNNLFTRKF